MSTVMLGAKSFLTPGGRVQPESRMGTDDLLCALHHNNVEHGDIRMRVGAQERVQLSEEHCPKYSLAPDCHRREVTLGHGQATLHGPSDPKRGTGLCHAP